MEIKSGSVRVGGSKKIGGIKSGKYRQIDPAETQLDA